MTQKPEIKIAIVDDHHLFSSSLEKLINTFSGMSVVCKAGNGAELKAAKQGGDCNADIILLDINMPVMNGYQTMDWLARVHPDQAVLALTMDDDEMTILRMIRGGAKGYLLKDMHPEELEEALNEVYQKGYYHSEQVTRTLINSLLPDEGDQRLNLKENELKFLELASTEMTYKEIADVMHLSPKTIDGYRQDLFQKLNVKNRVGLVMFGLKHNLIKLQ